MVPAAIVIVATALGCLVLWVEDRRELRRVKRDVARLLDRVEKLERIAAQ